MHKQPQISVVVPAYNAAETLKKSLLSVAAQLKKYPECEVLIVDDGSQDDTPKIIEQFEKWDKRFRGIRQENRGVSAARNQGIEKSASEYIAFLDADDLFLRDCLYERAQVLIEEDNPDLLGVFCPAVFIDMNGEILQNNRQFDYYLPGDRLYFSFKPESVFNPSCAIVKKSKVVEAGGFDETMTSAEDYDLWHKMMRSGGYFKKVSNCLIGWRQHDTSACHTNIADHYKHCKTVIRRVFSQSATVSTEECSGGYGESLYYLTITSRAFGSSIMAVVAGQYDDAIEISADINKTMLEQISPDKLGEMIRSNALRALSQPEGNWSTKVWPRIENDIMRLLVDLNERLGGDCGCLATLKGNIENNLA